MITGNTKVVINTKVHTENTNVINRLWTMVMDKVTDVIDYVMDESIDSDECDDCDGKNKKSSKLEINVESSTGCNTVIRGVKKNKEVSDKVLNMPSQVTQLESRIHTEHEVENNCSTITVGELVVVEDCPAYWSWASPFTVMAIDGEWAKLDMVGELVETKRLSKWDNTNSN